MTSEQPGAGTDATFLAAQVVERARLLGITIATGESLTAGDVASAIASIPGASTVLRGGVIAYDVQVKQRLLGVTSGALTHGIVSTQVAAEMAQGSARLLGSALGVGTTGVAGPEPHDGVDVGTVCIAVTLHDRTLSAVHHLAGGRADVRRQTVEQVLLLCLGLLDAEGDSGE